MGAMFFLISSEHDAASPLHRVDTQPFLGSDRSASLSPPNTTRGDIEEAPRNNEIQENNARNAPAPNHIAQQKSKCFWTLLVSCAALCGGLLYLLLKAFI